MRLKIVLYTAYIVLLLMFVSESPNIFGQNVTNITSSHEETTIAMTIKGSYLIIDAKLNGITRKFILDGSSDITLLNSKYSEQRVNSVDFYGVNLDKSNIETMDMSYIEKKTGIKIYGIVGYDLIKFYDLAFDYKEQTITLFKSIKHKKPFSPTPKKKIQGMFQFRTL